jgi:hypothetical protein
VNGSDDNRRVVTARLPSGMLMKVQLADVGTGDAMTSVGLQDLQLDEALDRVGEIGTAVVAKLKEAKPTKATVELRLGFAVEAGKLTALWVNGKGDASLTVTLEWSDRDASNGAGT